MAVAAINALHGTYIMKGCNRPLIVRFADAKRPKLGGSRSDTAFGGCGSGPRVHAPLGIRPESNHGDPTVGHIKPNAWMKMSPQRSGPSSQAHDYPSHSVAKIPVPAAMNSKASVTETSSGRRLLPLEKPLHPSLQLPPPLQVQVQSQETPVPSQKHTSPSTKQQVGQQQVPTSIGHCSQELPSQPSNGLSGHLSVPQFHTQQRTSSGVAQQNSLNLQKEGFPSTANQQQLCLPAIQQELQKPLQQLPNRLPQELFQAKHVLPTNFQSSQHTSSLVQQQLRQMQQSRSNPTQERWSEVAKQQASRTCSMQHAAARIHSTALTTASTSTTSSIPSRTWASAPPTCEWSEHTCPNGFKYYYNCITKESRWEKPAELIFFQQQRQNLSVRKVEVQPKAQNSVPFTGFVYPSHSTAEGSALSEISGHQKPQPIYT